MDKDNVFKSCNFYLDDGDVVHVLIKDFVGDSLSISLNDNDGTQEDETEIGTSGELYAGIYGALYNWMAATDLRSIANAGWHVPTVADFSILVAYLGASAGGKLKEAGLTYWLTPNEGATNAALFYGRGSGYRHSDGNFYSFKGTGKLWSADQQDANFAYFMGMYYYTASVLQSNRAKQYGMNIRLIKDSTILSHGQTGVYTGNDGKTYRTICIGTQEWLAQSLAETKFSNGENIPAVENAATWAALTTAGMCYYNNVEI